MFQFPRLPPACAGSRPSPAGFPHSGTPGSRPECGSPGTIAACRALRRLPAPRHPPCALYTFGTQAPPASDRICVLSRNLFLFALCGSQGALVVTLASHGGRTLRRGRSSDVWDVWLRLFSYLPRKEVIQPHLPVRLPCYDFTPLAPHTFGASPHAVGPATSGADDSGGVTGGVYKARERIHRGVLIRDY